AAACSCAAVCSAWAPVSAIHSAYGATASAICVDDRPSHSSLASALTMASYPAAACVISTDTALHDEAAVISDAEPGPAHSIAEVTSGGSEPKSIVILVNSLLCCEHVGGLGGRVRA